eukprot:m.255845 g.255845  ORF g.255845 m.255845 type:complete len:409 (+) comp17559_c1_seq2:3398-4624(+)
MRLRVRRRNEDGTSVTARVNLAQTATRHELMVKLSELISNNDFPPLPPSWELSLNGKSCLASHDTSPLSALGICGGDLIYIIDSPNEPSPQVVSRVTSTQPAVPAQAVSQATQQTASSLASATCRDVSLTAAEPMETTPDSSTVRLDLSSHPDTQDPNLLMVLTALSNYGFHLSPDTSAPALLAQGILQALEVYPAFAPQTVMRVKLVTMAGQLCVHARWHQAKAQGPVKSVVLPCATSIEGHQPLCRQLQDRLVHPLSLELRAHMKLPSTDCLVGLPTEVKVTILRHLDHQSLTRMAQVNKEFNLLCQLPQLWQRLLLYSYGVTLASEQPRITFVRRYQQQLQQERRQRQEAIPWLPGPPAGWHNPNVFFPPPRLPTIGGDHDLFPFLPFLDPRHRRRRYFEPWDAV